MKFAKIEIGGGTREIRFGLKTLGDSINHYDQDPAKLMLALEKNPFEAVPIVFYYGLKYGAEKKGEIFNHSLSDVYDWVEELGLQSDTVDQVSKMYIRSLYENVPAVKAAIDTLDDESKKNLIGTWT